MHHYTHTQHTSRCRFALPLAHISPSPIPLLHTVLIVAHIICVHISPSHLTCFLLRFQLCELRLLLRSTPTTPQKHLPNVEATSVRGGNAVLERGRYRDCEIPSESLATINNHGRERERTFCRSPICTLSASISAYDEVWRVYKALRLQPQSQRVAVSGTDVHTLTRTSRNQVTTSSISPLLHLSTPYSRASMNQRCISYLDALNTLPIRLLRCCSDRLCTRSGTR
jgi:hypothetical protein